jgi:hypothetical protein
MEKIAMVAGLLFIIKQTAGEITLKEKNGICSISSTVFEFIDLKKCDVPCKDVVFYDERFEEVTKPEDLKRHFIFPARIYEFVDEDNTKILNRNGHFILSACLKKETSEPNSPTHFFRVFRYNSNLAVFIRTKPKFFKEKDILEAEIDELEALYHKFNNEIQTDSTSETIEENSMIAKEKENYPKGLNDCKDTLVDLSETIIKLMENHQKMNDEYGKSINRSISDVFVHQGIKNTKVGVKHQNEDLNKRI